MLPSRLNDGGEARVMMPPAGEAIGQPVGRAISTP